MYISTNDLKLMFPELFNIDYSLVDCQGFINQAIEATEVKRKKG